jgi:hypothetical protein
MIVSPVVPLSLLPQIPLNPISDTPHTSATLPPFVVVVIVVPGRGRLKPPIRTLRVSVLHPVRHPHSFFLRLNTTEHGRWAPPGSMLMEGSWPIYWQKMRVQISPTSDVFFFTGREVTVAWLLVRTPPRPAAGPCGCRAMCHTNTHKACRGCLMSS